MAKRLLGLVTVAGVILLGFGLSFAAGGTIAGSVMFSGTAPQPKKHAVNKDTAKCGKEAVSEELVVGANKGIQWAVVQVVGAKMGKPSEAPKIDQHGCKFAPRVVVVPAGGTLTVFNSDKILHNLHTYSKANRPINKAHPKFRKSLKQKFRKAEIVKLTCDVHDWMLGWIVVADSPTAVTDGKGAFRLDNVPPGKYKLKVWHEKLGESVQDVTVKSGGTTNVSFTMNSK